VLQRADGVLATVGLAADLEPRPADAATDGVPAGTPQAN
jgi:hypothetical protein